MRITMAPGASLESIDNPLDLSVARRNELEGNFVGEATHLFQLRDLMDDLNANVVGPGTNGLPVEVLFQPWIDGNGPLLCAVSIMIVDFKCRKADFAKLAFYSSLRRGRSTVGKVSQNPFGREPKKAELALGFGFA
jgi:hypothetical protein